MEGGANILNAFLNIPTDIHILVYATLTYKNFVSENYIKPLSLMVLSLI